MRTTAIVWTLLAGWVLSTAALAAEGPAFPYDRSRTPVYLEQALRGSAAGTATELRKKLSAMVDEILDGPWLPLYSDYSAAQARERMQKDKPVFFYVKTLSALVGYYRLARHLGQQDEAQWARQTFDTAAAMTLEQRSAPYLWSDPRLIPEIGRLIRDAAGAWLDELAGTANVGNLPATDWSYKIVPGKRDYYVMNPYTWYHAWGGQGEGIRPRTVMGAFLGPCLFARRPGGAGGSDAGHPLVQGRPVLCLETRGAQPGERKGWMAARGMRGCESTCRQCPLWRSTCRE